LKVESGTMKTECTLLSRIRKNGVQNEWSGFLCVLVPLWLSFKRMGQEKQKTFCTMVSRMANSPAVMFNDYLMARNDCPKWYKSELKAECGEAGGCPKCPKLQKCNKLMTNLTVCPRCCLKTLKN